MKVSVYFMCLCFLLLKAGAPTHAAAGFSADGYNPAVNLSLNNLSALGDEARFEKSVPQDEQSIFLIDDAEDEDANDFFARKFRLLVRTWPDLLSYQSPLPISLNRSKAAPSFFGRIPYKYLQQRVWRV